MKRAQGANPQKAFTLVEVLLVLSVLLLLAVSILPIFDGRCVSPSMRCLINLKESAFGCIMFAEDNGGAFPTRCAVTNGGSMEWVGKAGAASHFKPIAPYIKDPNLLHCWTDQVKQPATNFDQFDDRNLSYFVNVDAMYSAKRGVLIGDRHLACAGKAVPPGLLNVTTNLTLGWTRELHPPGPNGCVAFVDGHSEVTRGDLLNVLSRQQFATNRLAIP
jgi:prepilin-type N-terminal cleavage/methylation domain-containing protein